MAILMAPSSILEAPALYLVYQSMVGGIRARRICLRDYVERTPGMVVIDIGCGPGYTAKWLPESRFFGFDVCRSYIDYATRKFGSHAVFRCDLFSQRYVSILPKADLVLMMGLLHHLPDEECVSLLRLAKSAMKDGGKLLTLDGCYRDGQSRIARCFLDWDRGEYIRTPESYVRIAQSVFGEVIASVRDDLFFIPSYTNVVLSCIA
jgi:cyclopropane fatty-acyl-phospholipid synthase-like methyltransferase